MEQELAEREYLESHATELNGTEGERRRARRTARELGRDAYVKALECTVITSESEKATLKAILESQQLNPCHNHTFSYSLCAHRPPIRARTFVQPIVSARDLHPPAARAPSHWHAAFIRTHILSASIWYWRACRTVNHIASGRLRMDRAFIFACMTHFEARADRACVEKTRGGKRASALLPAVFPPFPFPPH
eukprot:IDg10200t1